MLILYNSSIIISISFIEDCVEKVAAMNIRHTLISSLIALAGASIPFQSFAGIFFQDDFESGDLGHRQNGTYWDGSKLTAVKTDNPKTGNYSLEFRYPANPDGADGFSEQRFKLGGKYPDIWVSYDFFVPTNYYHRSQAHLGQSDNNKGFINFWEGSYNDPKGPALAVEFWPLNDGSSRGTVHTFKPGYYDGHATACPNAIKLSDRGQWIHITIHAKYTSSGKSDGAFQLWKTYSNGTTELACDLRNKNWYVPGQTGFDTGYLLGWSNSGFTSYTKFYIDNIKFSDTSLLGNLPAPPSPPTGIK